MKNIFKVCLKICLIAKWFVGRVLPTIYLDRFSMVGSSHPTASKLKYLLFTLSVISINSNASWDITSKLESETYSEIAPIKQTINDLEGGQIDFGKIAFTHNQCEIGISDNFWYFGVFARYDYHMQFSNDAAQLIYYKNNDISLEEGEYFDFDLKANRLLSKGFSIGYSITTKSNFTGSVKLNYLNSSNMTYGSLNGGAVTNDGDLEANLSLDYSYDEDLLFERPIEGVQGHGYSFDLSINWKPVESLEINIDGYDIYSEVIWKEVTYTKANATTDIIERDEDGFPEYNPVLSGIEDKRDIKQRLPVRYDFKTNYYFENKDSLELGVKGYDNERYPYLGYRMKSGKNLFNFGYGVKTKSLSFAFSRENLGVGIATDKLNPDKAKYFRLYLSYRIAL